ncbi:MAG: branched-chain amino acid aminotransferase [Burkholderiaceae bacterium]
MALGEIIWTYFEGRWHESNLPIMRAADHGTWLGSLVFDGARRFERVAPDLDRHLDRVNRSCEALGMRPTLSLDQMLTICHDGLERIAADEAVYIRPMYWSVDSAPNAVAADPESTAFALCLETLPMAAPRTAATLGLTRFTRPTIAQATVNAKAACLYPNNGRMLRDVNSRGFSNALVCDPLGNVAESATSNVFMARDGEVFTPVPNGTFLDGITRQRIISLLRADGVPVHEITLRLDDFRAADEIFLTGNIGKVTPVVRLEDRELAIGPMARRARECYWDWAHSSAARAGAGQTS